MVDEVYAQAFTDLVELGAVEQQREHLQFARRDVKVRRGARRRFSRMNAVYPNSNERPAGPDIGCVRTAKEWEGMRDARLSRPGIALPTGDRLADGLLRLRRPTDPPSGYAAL